MASSKSPSSARSGQDRPATRRKQRAEPAQAKARAAGGGLRSTPAEDPPGRSASTGCSASRASARDHANSRSSNAGGGRKRNVPRQP